FHTDHERILRLAAVQHLYFDEGPALADVRAQEATEVAGRVGADDQRDELATGGEQPVDQLLAGGYQLGADRVDLALDERDDIAGPGDPGHRHGFAGRDGHLGVPARPGRLGHGDEVILEAPDGIAYGQRRESLDGRPGRYHTHAYPFGSGLIRRDG